MESTTSIRPRRRFQAGGALTEGAIYVERPADRELPDALRRGELCYVLSTRQIGKSSLRLRTARVLAAEGIACVTIDLTAIGTENTSAETWYIGLASEIALGLDLPPPDDFWETNQRLGPVHCFSRYLEDVVLREVQDRIVVFIDEIDATLSLPFSRDDFFAAVRAFYLRRVDRSDNERLTFCLLGVAAPGDLIADPTRTPFNIGRAIRIEDFSRTEADALAEGLAGASDDPGALLDSIFEWTAGHPYMTQTLCAELCGPARGQPVDTVVRRRFLERGRTEDANLQYAERWFDDRRLRRGGSHLPRMLRLYRRLLAGVSVVADPSDPVQLALRLTGLAAERLAAGPDVGERLLTLRNSVYAEVFDAAWVKQKERGRAIAEPLERWLESERNEDFLVGGEALRQMRNWAEDREDLTADERAFLSECERAEQSRAGAEERRKATRTLSIVLAVMATLLAIAFGLALWQYSEAKSAQNEVEAAEKERKVQNEAKEMEGAGR